MGCTKHLPRPVTSRRLRSALGRASGQWLLVICRVPAKPSSARTAVWRAMRRLGALALQHAVCLLPRSETNRTACTHLAGRIEEYGGEASSLETSSPDEAWQAKIVARFNAARDEEYEEVVDETERFGEEIARERRKGKVTFAERQDEESNLERLRTYLAQVQTRDTFGAAGQVHAVAAVERCAQASRTCAQAMCERRDGTGKAETPALVVSARTCLICCAAPQWPIFTS